MGSPPFLESGGMSFSSRDPDVEAAGASVPEVVADSLGLRLSRRVGRLLLGLGSPW